MEAIVHRRYGSPDVLQLEDIQKPIIKDKEVLVRVHATTVTSGDIRIRGSNVPALFCLPMRLGFGLTKPKNPIPGSEFAGEVESVGKDVERFQQGDQVFGTAGFGANAQFVAVAENGRSRRNQRQ